MNPWVLALAAVAGGVGAGMRYVADLALTRWMRPPWGIMVVNVVGSLVLGFVTGLAPSAEMQLIVGGGLLGGFTTFSAVSVSTVLLTEEGRTRSAVINTVGTFVLAIVAAGLGLVAGAAFSG